MAKVLTLTKKEIQERALYYIDTVGGRDAAASVVGSTRRAVDSWCAEADPRTIPSEKLMALCLEAHFRALYVSNYIRIIDIYDNSDELIGCTNRASDAQFLADIHQGYITPRSRTDGRTFEIVLTAEQRVRSRLRKIIAARQFDRVQICRTLGCDEYVLIDMQQEVARTRFGRMPNQTAVDILQTYHVA